jgi:hypothetical protein
MKKCLTNKELIAEIIKKHPRYAEFFELGNQKRALGRALWHAFVSSGLTKEELAKKMKQTKIATTRMFDAANDGNCTVGQLLMFERAVGVDIFNKKAPGWVVDCDEEHFQQDLFSA